MFPYFLQQQQNYIFSHHTMTMREVSKRSVDTRINQDLFRIGLPVILVHFQDVNVNLFRD